MITVTDNSIRQINAALLTLNNQSTAANNKIIESSVNSALDKTNANIAIATENAKKSILREIGDVSGEIAQIKTDAIIFGNQYAQPYNSTVTLTTVSGSHKIGVQGFSVPKNSNGLFGTLTVSTAASTGLPYISIIIGTSYITGYSSETGYSWSSGETYTKATGGESRYFPGTSISFFIPSGVTTYYASIVVNGTSVVPSTVNIAGFYMRRIEDVL